MSEKMQSHDIPEISWLNKVCWNPEGLVPAVAQCARSGRILMLAWMNQKALEQTWATRKATYWSRSRQSLWVKGDTSGHWQDVVEIRLDCDYDSVLVMVHAQGGIACHTGRPSCFFYRLEDDQWVIAPPVSIMDAYDGTTRHG